MSEQLGIKGTLKTNILFTQNAWSKSKKCCKQNVALAVSNKKEESLLNNKIIASKR